MALLSLRLIYDPEKGDDDGGIGTGIPLEEIEADWLCPVCGFDKSGFEKVE